MTRRERNGSVRFGQNSHTHVIARRERSDRRGNPLHAMGVYRVCPPITGSQWIATGEALAMTRRRTEW